jgi:hypothetical protein
MAIVVFLTVTECLVKIEIRESILENHFQGHLSPLARSVSSSILLGWRLARSFGDWTLDLGRLIASSCRQRVLQTLSEVKQTHMMDLVRRVNSTLVYTQLVNFEGDEYMSRITKSVEGARHLVEAGFDYVTDVDGYKLFRKPK